MIFKMMSENVEPYVPKSGVERVYLREGEVC